jgi:hypothetical protein
MCQYLFSDKRTGLNVKTMKIIKKGKKDKKRTD